MWTSPNGTCWWPERAAILWAKAFRPSADLNESNRASFMEVQNKTTHHPILKSKTTSHSFSHCRGTLQFPVSYWRVAERSPFISRESGNRQPLGFKDTGKMTIETLAPSSCPEWILWPWGGGGGLWTLSPSEANKPRGKAARCRPVYNQNRRKGVRGWSQYCWVNSMDRIRRVYTRREAPGVEADPRLG